MSLDSIPNDLRLIQVPAGQFLAGSPEYEVGRHPFESPRHLVEISQSFEMAATPITQRQFQEVMGYNPSYFHGFRQHPVENITWYEAAAFCNALSILVESSPLFILAGSGKAVKVTGITEDGIAGGAFRLPTEEEWEYGCRAGVTAPYWWGSDKEALAAHTWWRGNSGDQTQPVNAIDHENPWGLSDMIGNVWEWCFSDWQSDYSKAISENDPQRVAQRFVDQDFAKLHRLWRGGSWFCTNPGDLRSAFRVNAQPTLRSPSVGFRVVRCPPLT